MPKYTITESVGSRLERVGRFEDLEKHHPSSGRELGRNYATINGELEEVRLLDGRTYIKKDFILSQDTPGPVSIPAPASGYIHHLNDATNAVRIYDRPYGTPGAVMLAQSLHMTRGTSPPEGSYIQYGSPMGRMGDTGSPGSVHAHVEAELGTFQRYIRDIANGTIQPGVANPLADGVLREGEQGAPVRELQQQLNRLGARDARGRALAEDGDFGSSTREAVQALQRSRNLEDDGVVGRDTFAVLRQAPGATPPTSTPPPAQGQPPAQTPPASPAPAQPQRDFGPTALSNLIGSGEGGYNSYNRGRAGDAGGRQIDFSQLSVGEVMRRQALPRSNPESLFAVGKFQIIPGTMRETVGALGIDRNARFTPALQERMFADYLVDEKRPAVHAYITGRSSGASGLQRAQIALAQEFASVADPRTGRSYYEGDSAGNSSSITAAQAAAALDMMRRQYQANIERGLAPDTAYRALSGAAPAPTPAPRTNGRDGLLDQGDRGERVVRLQQDLNALGVRDGRGRPLVADGEFGARTREAVEAFQRREGLAVDGVVGPRTVTALARERAASTERGSTPNPAPAVPPSSARTLSEGDRGAEVSALQRQLARFGYRDGDGQPIVADGNFGFRTRAAVESFQRTHGLPIDGIVGAQTRGALTRAEQLPLLSEPRHPDHALYRQALDRLTRANVQAPGRLGERELQSIAATLAFEARVSGLDRVDHVVTTRNGNGVFAVQGDIDDPAHRRVFVDRAQAASQPIERSTFQLEQERQVRQVQDAAPREPRPVMIT